MKIIKRGKKYKDVLKIIDSNKKYSIKEASEIVKKTSINKFDATIDLSINANLVSEKVSQSSFRGVLILPHNNGKKKTILAITSRVDEAKKLGADYAGNKDIIDKIMKEKWFKFDVAIATPEMMIEVSKIAHLLGPKGLMPNPKNGTISNDLEKMIKEIQAGKIEYRADKNGNINVSFARVSFSEKQIEENLQFICSSIVKNKPSVVKKGKNCFINNAVIHTTMGPAIHITFPGM